MDTNQLTAAEQSTVKNTSSEPLASGLTQEQEFLFLQFIHIVGNDRHALDLLATNVKRYWRIHWDTLELWQCIWFARVANVPLSSRVDVEWEKMTLATRAMIERSTHSMAVRAVQLIDQWKAEVAA